MVSVRPYNYYKNYNDSQLYDNYKDGQFYNNNYKDGQFYNDNYKDGQFYNNKDGQFYDIKMEGLLIALVLSGVDGMGGVE